MCAIPLCHLLPLWNIGAPLLCLSKKRIEGHGGLPRGRPRRYGPRPSAPLGAYAAAPDAQVQATSFFNTAMGGAPTVYHGAPTVYHGAPPCLPGAHAAPLGALAAPFRSCTRSSSGPNTMDAPGSLPLGTSATLAACNRGTTTAAAATTTTTNAVKYFETVLSGTEGASTLYSCLIPIIVDNKIFSSLLDTGSTVSIIERSAVTSDIQINDTVLMRTAGEGPGFVSKHKVLQSFLINDKVYFHEFLVVDTLNWGG